MFTCITRYMCVSERSNTNTVSAEIENPRSTKGMYKLYLRMFRRHEGNSILCIDRFFFTKFEYN